MCSTSDFAQILEDNEKTRITNYEKMGLIDWQKYQNLYVLGPQGCGKSTLIKCAARDLNLEVINLKKN